MALPPYGHVTHRPDTRHVTHSHHLTSDFQRLQPTTRVAPARQVAGSPRNAAHAAAPAAPRPVQRPRSDACQRGFHGGVDDTGFTRLKSVTPHSTLGKKLKEPSKNIQNLQVPKNQKLF